MIAPVHFPTHRARALAFPKDVANRFWTPDPPRATSTAGAEHMGSATFEDIMRRFAGPAISLILVLSAASALAGASSAPFGFTPDPAMRTESVKDLESRVRRACASTQARIQSVSTETVAKPCSCYATRLMRSFDENEVAAYRTTGVFVDTARVKAISAIDDCRLKRPI